MRRPNPLLSMLTDYADRRGPAGPSLSQGLGLSMDPSTFSIPTSLTQQSPNQTYGSQGAASTDYSRTSTPTPINVDDYLAKLFPPQAPQPQPGKWEKALGGVGNAIQGFHNDMMGYPHALNSGPGGWSAIGSLIDRKNGVDQQGQKPGAGSIGTAMPAAMSASIAMGGPAVLAGLASMLNGGGTKAWDGVSHAEPDADQNGGPSDNDADNPGSEAARSAVEKMVAASPMASARPVGGFQLGGTGGLAEKLRNSSVYQPPDRSMRQAGPYRPEMGAAINPSLTSAASIPAPRVSSTPTAASFMGSRPQPVLPPQSNAVVDIMNQSDPLKQQAMRHQLLRSLGGGF